MTAARNLAGRRTAIYRWFDANDRLLYVGITANPGQRVQHHEYNQPWFAAATRCVVEWYETRAEAEAAELVAIRREEPLRNTRGFVKERASEPAGSPRRGGWPGPRKVQKVTPQDPAQVERVQAYAEAEGIKYAEAMRRLVDAGLEKEDKS